MGIVWVVKQPQMYVISINGYLSLKFASMPCHAKKPSGFIVCLCAFYILVVRKPIRITQIIDPIVRSVAVYMINITKRRISVNIEPSKSMGEVKFLINSNAEITIFPKRTSDITYFYGVAGHGYPCKFASLRIVGKKFTQAFCGNHKTPHHSVASGKAQQAVMNRLSPVR
jgi:hypothetical protein